MITPKFGSITGIMAWVGDKNSVRYVAGDEQLPFVYKDKLYQYFTFDGQKYTLSMTSFRDLNEVKK